MSHSAGSPLNRRRFLKLSAGAAVGVACAGGALRWFTGGYASQLSTEDRPIGVSTKEFVILRALVEMAHPAMEADGSPETAMPSGLSLGVHQRLDQEIWAAAPAMQSDLRNALQVLEHAPLLLGHFGRFSSLHVDAREKAFSQMLQSSNAVLAQVAGGLKEVVHFFYFSRPEVWPAIGYEGPFVQKAIPPASELAYAELLKKARATT